MLSSTVVFIVAMLIFVAVAVASLAAFALTRRSVAGWRVRMQESAEALSARPTPITAPEMSRESLSSVLGLAESSHGSGYLDATTLPGYDQLERTVSRVYRAGKGLQGKVRR
ncbi:MAG: hypothetical protein Q4C87_08820 [Actinomycetaceae bacterium]|nr:hypothetical protein [Actinomycetaceae bacterium]